MIDDEATDLEYFMELLSDASQLEAEQVPVNAEESLKHFPDEIQYYKASGD